MLYTIYKTINISNNKEYIGFHSIKDVSDILYEESDNGSIFADGYLGSGKLMKMALEKYGPLNMKQKLLLVTSDKDEAEEFEKELVNREWVDSDSNYNLSIGGNVTILFGENNGFYGKKHTSETITRIQNSRNKTLHNDRFTWSESYNTSNGKKYFTRQDIIDDFGIDSERYTDIKHEVNRLVSDGVIQYASSYLNQKAIDNFNRREEMLSRSEEMLERKRKECSDRFRGIPKSKESNEKRGKSISAWIDNNPDDHKKRMDKINKNPEKIRKTAEKQTGKVWICNKALGKNTRHDPKLPMPEGWERGFIKKKGL